MTGTTKWLFLPAAMAAAQPAALVEAAPSLDPAVSADGRLLAFTSKRDGGGWWSLWIRPLAGGEARRLTDPSHDVRDPAFSPDGRLVAFRSERGRGGIYLVPSEGGKARLFAPGGHRPRFSPDGRQIAYAVVTGARAALFLRDVAGGRAQAVHREFYSAQDPVWSADGRHWLFRGCRDGSGQHCDWWVSPPGEGEPAATGAAAAFRAARLEDLPGPGLWLEQDRVVFPATAGGNTRLWWIPLKSRSWRVEGAPRRLTRGEADERMPALAPGGKIVFAGRTTNIDIWGIPLDANAAKPGGGLARLAGDASVDQRPSLSRDGRRMAWETTRGGNFEVWVKDFVTGAERAVTNGPLREHMPALAPDGTRLTYDAHDGEKVTIFESAFDGGPPAAIREENVGQGSFQWTEKSGVLYFHRAPPGTVGLLNLATGNRRVLLRHRSFNLSLADARLAPSGDRIVFPVPVAPHQSRLAIADVSGAPIEDEKNWTYLTPAGESSAQPEWSPDGEWVYFLSDRGGRPAVWAVRTGRGTRPQGPPRRILDFPESGPSIAEMRPRDIGLAVARDKLALAAAETSGALWSVPAP